MKAVLQKQLTKITAITLKARGFIEGLPDVYEFYNYHKKVLGERQYQW